MKPIMAFPEAWCPNNRGGHRYEAYRVEPTRLRNRLLKRCSHCGNVIEVKTWRQYLNP